MDSKDLGEEIEILGRRRHAKASEEYLDVAFRYDDEVFEWSIPIEYRRTGTHLADYSDEEIADYATQVYVKCHPKNWATFLETEGVFWDQSKPGAVVTKSFFDGLAADFRWKSVKDDLPANSNSQRRIQDLKEFGYTVATNTNMVNPRTGVASTHHLLLPLPRGGITGYETWSPKLRARIIKVLEGIDAYEGKAVNYHGLLPDHKFPEIRWDDDVKRENLESLTDEEIRQDFQLVTNQRNLQKREVCRSCFQTGERGVVFGLNFFYAGDKTWPDDVPVRGKAAEAGCVGCGWYDLKKWREAANRKLDS